MIIYREVPAKKKIIATLINCEDDVINLLNKRSGGKLCFDCDESLKLKPRYTASITCHDDDTYNFEEGKRRVKKRVLNKYDKDFNRVLSNLEDTTVQVHTACVKVRAQLDGRMLAKNK